MAGEPGASHAADGGNQPGRRRHTRPAAPWPGEAWLSRRKLLQEAGLVATGMTLWGGSAAAATGPGRGASAATAGAGRTAAGPVPSLDDLAGEWMSAGTLLNMPSASNFHGGLHAGWNLLSFLELTFPPLSLGGECARLSLNGINVQAHESRWYPYQVVRRAAVGSLTLQSAVRMAFEEPVVLMQVEVANTGRSQADAAIEVSLGGYVRAYPGPWEWTVPREYADFSAWNSQLAAGGQVLVVADGSSAAAAAFAFPTPPGALVPDGSSGTATWPLSLHPGERRTLQLIMTAGPGAAAAAESAAAAGSRFQALFGAAKDGWEQRFADAFTPGNAHFSGSLPVLDTADQPLRDLYYRGVVSLLALERTSYPQYFPRVYTTAGPQWGVTLSYFWDTSLFAPLLVLLDPVMAREQTMRWLELGIYSGYAVDALSGTLVGPWYSANDLSVFTMLLSYLNLTGDVGFLDEQAGGTSVIDHMQAIALHWQQLAVPATGLADYGAQSNLLEEVPDYVNQVPSLNAANVWMMRQVAALRQTRGETAAAGQLTQLAAGLAGRVLGLYVPGQGYWETVHDDGTRVGVRHVYDFDTIGRLMTEDLTPDIQSQMASLVTSGLLAGDWMRALSLSDPDAPLSLRPDHGSNGAYDAWPALAAGAMACFGRYETAAAMLRSFSGAAMEGPFAQSHQLVPQPSGLVVWDRDDLNPAAALTVTAWVNPAAWPAQYDQAPVSSSIVSKAATTGVWFPATPANAGYALRGGAGGTISFGVAAGGRFRQAVTTATVPTGSWHHVAGTYDGTRVAVYIDGRLAGTAPASGGLSPATGTNLMVGADPINPVDKLTGAVDEVRVYRRALSAAEIASMSAAADPAGGAGDPALVLRLAMDEGRGQQTVDAATGQEATILAGRWVAGRYGGALSFSESARLTHRISRQQYNENNGASFASTILTDLFGYTPDGQRIALRDPGTPRGVTASLRGIAWRGHSYTLTSTASGVRLWPSGRNPS